jgi:hypothetical protein
LLAWLKQDGGLLQRKITAHSKSTASKKQGQKVRARYCAHARTVLLDAQNEKVVSCGVTAESARELLGSKAFVGGSSRRSGNALARRASKVLGA